MIKTEEELIWESYMGRNKKYISSEEIIINLDHHTEEDLEDGDLIERIRKYDTYDTTVVDLYDIDEDQWDYDEDRVDEYAETMKSDYTPVILHNNNGYWEIVDGTHRINALKGRGERYVKAYVAPINN